MMKQNHYLRLGIMVGLSFIAMYALMYAMVDSISSVYNNFNQAYMAGLMAAPMVAIELVVMSAMYHNRRLNALLLAGSILAAALFWTLIRQQTAISDRQFLRSMIPHHAGAILMCTEARISDPEVRKLCSEIVESQRREIRQMKALLGQERSD